MTKTIYLAGPIADCTKGETHDWRDLIKLSHPHHKFLDPTDRDYRDRDTSDPRVAHRLVSDDKRDIRKADLVVAYCHKPSVGTSMEIIYANMIGVEVWAAVEGEPSPWIVEHARVFRCLEDMPL